MTSRVWIFNPIKASGLSTEYFRDLFVAQTYLGDRYGFETDPGTERLFVTLEGARVGTLDFQEVIT